MIVGEWRAVYMDFEALNRLAYFYRKFAQQDFSAKTTDALTKALKEAGYGHTFKGTLPTVAFFFLV